MKKYLGTLFSICAFIILAFLTMESCNTKEIQEVRIDVDPSNVNYTMQGGMGASWHAISAEIDLNNEKYKYPVREVGPRGSAYGGNPPVNNTKAWEQLKNHASWLGLNFIRVEIDQRMYEPKRNEFDWNNEEMNALYHILDYAEESGADVFLQQMWGHIDWNSYPGVHPIISAPKSLDDFANGIATLIEFLKEEKGYTCIKYFCMTNEPPGGTWGYWWEYGENEGKIEDAWARLKQEFDDREIDIPISGPDWTDMPQFDKDKLAFSKHLGAIDIHSYHGVTEEGEKNLKNWADWSHQQGKPFFLTEYGNMNLGWGDDDPNQKSFEAALSNASDVMRGMRAGVDAFNRWSYTNRGDLDGQWQLVKTLDRTKNIYLDDVHPEVEAYYGFGIISRFLSKYSSVVSCEVQASDSVLMCNAVISPEGKISIFLINKSSENLKIQLNFKDTPEHTLHLYQVSKEIVNKPGFQLSQLKSFSVKELEISLPPKSISTLSQNLLTSDENGIILN